MMLEMQNHSKVHHMRCGVHTLQLAIPNGLAERNDNIINNLISKIRQVIVAARKPHLEEIIK